VGSRRAAAERLLASVKPQDEAYVLDQLEAAPDGARFALVQVLGLIGTELALPPIYQLLQDPFARAEAAEALSLIAQRTGSMNAALVAIQEPGLGVPWRWAPRARLGDGSWVEALLDAWEGLSTPQRIQALESARFLPEALRSRVKAGTVDAQRAGGNLHQTWTGL
jgi:HEAT repeat protein